ncbi:MAG: pilus assembly protein [Desulfobacteraceae bacterium]|nr:MAG: pilus assembly protein [Desulfobacteraceae bacterium]
MFSTRTRDERGGSLVEFAVVLPILFIVLFGVVELGVLLYDKAMITNASREGARAGIVYDTAFRNADESVNSGAVTAKVNEVVSNYQGYLISFGSGSTITVEVSVGGATGDPLRVTVRYPFRFLAFSNILALFGGGGGDLITLKSESVMRLE